MMKRMSGSIKRRRASSKKFYLLHDCEKVLERPVANINDSWTVFLGDQPVEQCHLATSVANVDNRRDLWQIVRQLRTFVGQVECRNGSIFENVEFGEQPRNQSLSDASTRGADDVERSGLAGHARVRRHSSSPVPRGIGHSQ